jgi:hypothetical protein
LHHLDTIDFLVFNRAKTTLSYIGHHRSAAVYRMSYMNFNTARATTALAENNFNVEKAQQQFAIFKASQPFILFLSAYAGRIRMRHSD